MITEFVASLAVALPPLVLSAAQAVKVDIKNTGRSVYERTDPGHSCRLQCRDGGSNGARTDIGSAVPGNEAPIALTHTGGPRSRTGFIVSPSNNRSES